MNPIPVLRKIALVEAVSFLVLLGITMPLKYLAHMPMAVKICGWIHGILFIAAAVFVDAVVRLLPGVLGDANSAPDDSFASGLIEGPQYTRPMEFRGWRVPEVLLSGNHGAIAKWRREQTLERTRRLRPDLLGEERTSNTQRPTSNIQHPTSNIQRPESER